VLALEQRDRTQMTWESLRFRLTSSARASIIGARLTKTSASVSRQVLKKNKGWA
jgi:hypothetical protein